MGVVKEILSKAVKSKTIEIEGIELTVTRPSYDAAAAMRREILADKDPKKLADGALSPQETVEIGQKLLIASVRLCVPEAESDEEVKELLLVSRGRKRRTGH